MEFSSFVSRLLSLSCRSHGLISNPVGQETNNEDTGTAGKQPQCVLIMCKNIYLCTTQYISINLVLL